jgi:hypothetical protein
VTGRFPARRVRPRVLPPNAPRVRLRASAYSATAINVSSGILLVATGLMALALEATAPRVFMLAIAAITAPACVCIRGQVESLDDGCVRVDGRRRATRFVPTRLVSAVNPILASLAIVPAAAIISVGGIGSTIPSLVDFGRWGPFGLAGLGLALLAREVVALATPRGLLLTAAGLTGIRGARRIDLGWDDVLGVGVIDARRAFLAIRTTSGLLKVEPYAIGSDPNVVAPIVRHYLTHPEDRHLLADPVAAIRRVEEAVSAQT